MAASPFPSSQHFSENCVESAGAVLFHLSTKRICMLHLTSKDEYLLPKGRRNIGESRQQAAFRELEEETGYASYLLPVTMPSRAPPAIETEQSSDQVRTYTAVVEPISVQIRQLKDDAREIKLIWWFAAAINEEKPVKEDRPGGERYEVKFYSYEEAVTRLTYQPDRELVGRVLQLVKADHP